MAKTARLGDPFGCGDTIASASGDVFANGIPVARLTDSTTGDPCGAPPTVISDGSNSIFVNNLKMARVGDPLAPHACPSSSPHGSSISAGSPNVNAG